ncbi:propionyl-CoA carboxylase alpha chain-like protein [Sarcoptes scabiei]|nr:propionyl-CoA carboxylase alpha chain-like protein [Sarcoptes scabiei]
MYFADHIDPNESIFKKVLIANRGEIACRIIRTCRSMGIKTVAIHSDIDSSSLHVKYADEAYCVGTAQSSASYLNVEAILDVIKKSGADAVHPGYGFLSENMDFAKQLDELGIVFVGPNSYSVHAMGDKIESKLIAQKAKVNTIPGYEGIIKDADHCVQLAKEIGYPVMIKASAGGGGKGMRMAYSDQEAYEGFRFSKQEAMASFKDDRLLIEKFIEEPRHIEIQVLCDKHGNGVYLNERECSIQRRNQKVIEEAPSVFLDAELRKSMGQQALALAHNVGYDSAGTVEFLVDKHRNFYFLEMNTRLQVEHPITEFICGIDIVHQMLRIAKGHKLKHTQDDIKLRGWAVESRVYAENPYKNFGLPSIGRLTRYEEPTYLPNVRCDSGVTEGSDINIYYDPLICKLITYGDDRHDALANMAKSLDNYVIRGLTHNIPLLRDIITETNFVKGNINTKYLTQIYPDGFKGRNIDQNGLHCLSAIASAIFVRYQTRSKNFRNDSNETQRSSNTFIQKEVNDFDLHIDLSDNINADSLDSQRTKVIYDRNAEHYIIKVNENEFETKIPSNFSLASMTIDFKIKDQTYTVQLISITYDGLFRIQFEGTIFNVRILEEKAFKYLNLIPKKPKIDYSKIIKSPMPGLVKSIAVNLGDKVNEGQELCVIEAMKMQNSLVAESSGKVIKINCKVGETVDGDQVLLQLE